MSSMKMLVPVLTTASILISPLANAKFFWEKEEEKVNKSYISAAYGSFSSDGKDIDVDERYHEFGIGAKLSKHFGVEATYTDFGTLTGDTVEAEYDGFSANVIGYFPITDYADAYIKGGIFFSKISLSTLDYSKSFKDEQPTIGAGFNVVVSDSLTLFAEYSYFNVEVNEDDLPALIEQTEYEANTMKIGLKFTF